MRRSVLGLAGALLFFLPLYAQQKEDALEQYRRGNFSKSIEICLAEIAQNPNNLNSYIVICWSYSALNQYAQVIDYGLKGIKISEYDQRLMHSLGEAYFYTRSYALSLQYLMQYIALTSFEKNDFRIASAYYYLGEILIQEGKYQNADIALSAAVFLKDNNAAWFVRLGWVRETNKDYKKALEAYQKAKQLKPDWQDAVDGEIRVQQKLGL